MFFSVRIYGAEGRWSGVDYYKTLDGARIAAQKAAREGDRVFLCSPTGEQLPVFV